MLLYDDKIESVLDETTSGEISTCPPLVWLLDGYELTVGAFVTPTHYRYQPSPNLGGMLINHVYVPPTCKSVCIIHLKL